MPKKANLTTGTGRRKTAVASVFMYDKPGNIIVNEVPIEEYFSDLPYEVQSWKKPFNLLEIKKPRDHFDFSIKVKGSGISAQLDAVIHGISWALANFNEDYAVVLRRAGMLTRDPRMVERKKYWLRKARKAPQYSKR